MDIADSRFYPMSERSIRLAQEFAFLNHHTRNAITQMTMASYLEDLDKPQRIRTEVWERICGALRRIARSAELNALSLECNLLAAELAQEGVAGIPKHLLNSSGSSVR